MASDDMQDDASDRLRFLLRYLEIVKIATKNFLTHFGSCFVYVLLHPVSCAPRFCQMKDVINPFVPIGTWVSQVFKHLYFTI